MSLDVHRAQVMVASRSVCRSGVAAAASVFITAALPCASLCTARQAQQVCIPASTYCLVSACQFEAHAHWFALTHALVDARYARRNGAVAFCAPNSRFEGKALHCCINVDSFIYCSKAHRARATRGHDMYMEIPAPAHQGDMPKCASLWRPRGADFRQCTPNQTLQ